MVPEIPASISTAEASLAMAVDASVDARHLACPMPLLKAKQALQRLQAGQHLRVLATDPGSLRDFRAWAAQSGHRLLCAVEADQTFIYILRKSN